MVNVPKNSSMAASRSDMMEINQFNRNDSCVSKENQQTLAVVSDATTKHSEQKHSIIALPKRFAVVAGYQSSSR